MFILIIGIVFIIFGYMILAIVELYPILRLIYLDWIASILFIVPFIICLYRMWISNTFKHVDKKPLWKELINYMRNDNEIIPMYGTRAYAGESFLDVPRIGLIEYIGKECVYGWGDKKQVFAIENSAHTPNPKHFNLSHILVNIGLDNSDDVIKVIRGDDLYLMGIVYQKMKRWDNNHGAKKLVSEMLNYKGENIDFKKDNVKDIHKKVDKLKIK